MVSINVSGQPVFTGAKRATPFPTVALKWIEKAGG